MDVTRPDHREVRAHDAHSKDVVDLAEDVVVRRVLHEDHRGPAGLRVIDEHVDAVALQRVAAGIVRYGRVAGRWTVVFEEERQMVQHVLARFAEIDQRLRLSLERLLELRKQRLYREARDVPAELLPDARLLPLQPSELG